MLNGERTLNRLLSPFAEALARPDTREIVVNRKPGEFGVEGANGWTWHQDGRLDYEWLFALGRYAAQVGTSQDFGPNDPTRSSRLPGDIPRRITMSCPPITPPGVVTIDIRQRAADFVPTLEWLHDRGWFSFLDQTVDWVELLRRWIVEDRCNIEITAATAAGKTTALEAMAREVPEDERIITCESAPELYLPHRNWVPMLYGEGQEGNRTAEQTLESGLRQRPDRLIFGETRTGETWGWLRALNTGHKGCMSTTHANPGWAAMENALANQIRQNDSAQGIPGEDLKNMIRDGIDVLICVEKKSRDKIPFRATLIERRAA